MRCEALIIGAGVNGLGTALALADRGLEDVVVLEKRYPMYGGSGRNGGGVRAQWASLSNLALARDAIGQWRSFADRLGLHTWFRQSGYLMLAPDEAMWRAMRDRAAFQRAHGVPTTLVNVDEAREIAPILAPGQFVGASYCPEDAVIFPWPVVNGLRERLAETDVRVVQRAVVTGVDTEGDRIRSVRTTHGAFEPATVVNAAGPWSKGVARRAGVDLPNEPVRHQIFVTEALRPLLDPLVVDLGTGLYVSQDGRGELVAGLGDREPEPGVRTSVTLDMLARASKELVRLAPSLAAVRVMRQWAGCYDVTPDHVPNLGPHPQLANFLQLNGFSGHGFMVAPEVTRITAQLVLGQAPDRDLTRYAVDRFDRGTTDPEPMVIG